MTPEQKSWIDNASYEELLRKWRFAPIGDPMFSGETGTYFSKIMRERKDQIGWDQHAATSKMVGWDQ